MITWLGQATGSRPKTGGLGARPRLTASVDATVWTLSADVSSTRLAVVVASGDGSRARSCHRGFAR